MEDKLNVVDKVIQEQLEKLETLKPGTDEYKDVCNAIQKIGGYRNDNMKDQTDNWKEEQRLEYDRERLQFEKDKLEFEKMKFERDSELEERRLEIDKAKTKVNPNTIVNALTMTGLTLTSIAYDATGGIPPRNLLNYANKIKL